MDLQLIASSAIVVACAAWALKTIVDALPGKSFKGQIYAINPMVDVNGRALSVRGRISNTELTLRPGLFARLLVKGLSETDVVLVPESAILPRGGVPTHWMRIEPLPVPPPRD